MHKGKGKKEKKKQVKGRWKRSKNLVKMERSGSKLRNTVIKQKEKGGEVGRQKKKKRRERGREKREGEYDKGRGKCKRRGRREETDDVATEGNEN